MYLLLNLFYFFSISHSIHLSLSLSLSLSLWIYIYICVCVCVCLYFDHMFISVCKYLSISAGTYLFSLGFLCHINFHGLFKVKSMLVEEQLQYYCTHSWEGKEVIAFLNVSSNSTGVPTHFEATVQHFCHYVRGIPPNISLSL